jgi:hypothetical protein
MKRYHVESDGGSFWAGHYWSHQPETHYVVDIDRDERIECSSFAEAKKLAAKLNNGEQQKEQSCGGLER